ncbi:ABC transporter permease [Paenibacillus sp. sgz302251]|uniref:ABC transporter permease n=1 Tax=Paenibacillus sp. sgz302251 TaxID=3414493 RepID=UPI003C7AA129
MNTALEIKTQPAKPKSTRLITLFSNGTIISVLIFALVFVIYAGAGNNVLTAFSLNNLLNNTVALAIAATGLTLIILIGKFDMSVGGMVILSNVIVSSDLGDGIGGVLLRLIMVILAGAILGAINGFFVAYGGVQAIAITLATMIMCQGVALVLRPAPGGIVPMEISYGLTKLIGGVIPVAAIVILLFAAAWMFFRKTPFGVYIYGIGADERASVQAGIDVKKYTFLTFVLAGVIYGLAGFMLSAQTASGDASGGTLFLMLVFAAVAIGGTTFGGGKGSVIGSIVGAGILTVLQKMLFVLGVSTFYTNIYQGLILIAAVLIGGLSVKLSKRGETL